MTKGQRKRKRAAEKKAADARRRQEEDNRDARPPRRKGDPKGDPKGQGRGGAKGQGKDRPLPFRLVGQGNYGETANGERICWNYNLDGCNLATPGGTCQWGKHVCVRRSCNNAAHGYVATHR